MDVAEAMELVNVRARAVFIRCIEIILRIPGLLLFELWWRNREMHFTADTFNSSYVQVDQIILFIQARNFDQIAAQISGYAVLLLSFTFFLLPIVKLIKLYSHILSLLLFALSYYLSAQYVQLQIHGDPLLKLDDFSKLEQHALFAQLILCLAQCCLLNLQSDCARIARAVFLIPVIARTCAVPIDRLLIAHNISCSLAMLFMCIYVLNLLPAFFSSVLYSLLHLKTVITLHDITSSASIIWNKLRLDELLIWAWSSMFLIRVYVHVAGKGRHFFDDAGAIFLSSVAESTNTPLSLLALALTVSYLCKQIVDVAKCIVDGQGTAHEHVLVNGRIMQALTLLLLCAQTGFLKMRTEQKAFLLGLVLFSVVSALLQSLFEIVEPRLSALASNRLANTSHHVRSISLALFLILISFGASAAIARLLPLDLWCLIIVSNCLLIALHTLSALIIYGIFMFQSTSADFCERTDNCVFFFKMVTHALEVALALIVVGYGVLSSLSGQWTLASIAVLVLYLYFNVWRRIQAAVASVHSRCAASSILSNIPRVFNALLKQKTDICAICLCDMVNDVRITPCKHLFHSICLRRWLCIKRVCPLCNSDLSNLDI